MDLGFDLAEGKNGGEAAGNFALNLGFGWAFKKATNKVSGKSTTGIKEGRRDEKEMFEKLEIKPDEVVSGPFIKAAGKFGKEGVKKLVGAVTDEMDKWHPRQIADEKKEVVQFPYQPSWQTPLMTEDQQALENQRSMDGFTPMDANQSLLDGTEGVERIEE